MSCQILIETEREQLVLAGLLHRKLVASCGGSSPLYAYTSMQHMIPSSPPPLLNYFCKNDWLNCTYSPGESEASHNTRCVLQVVNWYKLVNVFDWRNWLCTPECLLLWLVSGILNGWAPNFFQDGCPDEFCKWITLSWGNHWNPKGASAKHDLACNDMVLEYSCLQ